MRIHPLAGVIIVVLTSWIGNAGALAANLGSGDSSTKAIAYAQLIVPKEIPSAANPTATTKPQQAEIDGARRAQEFKPEPLSPSYTDAPAPQAAASVTEEIRQFIDVWIGTICEKKLDEHCACYADQVDTYFTYKHLSNQRIAHDKVEVLKPYSSLQMQVANIEVQSATPSDAVVVFDKSWEAHGAKDFSGSEKQSLTLHRFGAAWKITSEEELKVYWVKKSK